MDVLNDRINEIKNELIEILHDNNLDWNDIYLDTDEDLPILATTEDYRWFNYNIGILNELNSMIKNS